MIAGPRRKSPNRTLTTRMAQSSLFQFFKGSPHSIKKKPSASSVIQIPNIMRAQITTLLIEGFFLLITITSGHIPAIFKAGQGLTLNYLYFKSSLVLYLSYVNVIVFDITVQKSL